MNATVSSTGFLLLPGLLMLVYIALFVLVIYALIVFIRLAHRGIQALDIYIRQNNHNRHDHHL